MKLTPTPALVLFVLTVGLLATAGGLMQQHFAFLGLALTELVVVLGPLLAMALSWGLPRTALGLRAVSWRSIAGGALVGAGGFYIVSAFVEAAVEQVAPLPPSVRDQMSHLIVPTVGPRPLALDLLVLALLPAVCEELLFRGALLEAWKPLGKAAAVGGTALAFAIFHLSFYKFLPTLALGLFAGAVAMRASSAIPSMVFHAVNNSLVVLLVRAGIDDPPAPTTRMGAILSVASYFAVAVGLWMICPPPSRGETDRSMKTR